MLHLEDGGVAAVHDGNTGRAAGPVLRKASGKDYVSLSRPKTEKEKKRADEERWRRLRWDWLIVYPLCDDFHSTFWIVLHSGFPSRPPLAARPIMKRQKRIKSNAPSFQGFSFFFLLRTVRVRDGDGRGTRAGPRVPRANGSVAVSAHQLLPVREPRSGSERLGCDETGVGRFGLEIPQGDEPRLVAHEQLKMKKSRLRHLWLLFGLVGCCWGGGGGGGEGFAQSIDTRPAPLSPVWRTRQRRIKAGRVRLSCQSGAKKGFVACVCFPIGKRN